MLQAARDPAALFDQVMGLHRFLRDLEKGIPVVAALTGTALGGGFEIALACHHRVALDDARIQIGLPEVSLGVIPGGGGTQRLSRRIGLQPTLENVLQGRTLRPQEALKAGFVDALAPDPGALLRMATDWIVANPQARQPWDRPGFTWPAPAPESPEARQMLMGAMAMLYQRTCGAFPAAEKAIQVVQEGARVSFDRSLEIEARAFVALALSDQARDMIRTLWFHRNAADKAEGLPYVAEAGVRKVGILGAGMMGAGLAWICALRGFDVVLKDIRRDVLDRAVAHFDGQLAKRAFRMRPEEPPAVRARLRTTLMDADLAGCDLVIEAVIEDIALKHRLIGEIEPTLSAGSLFASNTSALPITDLAKASSRPEAFIGMHFFSPVEKMPLLEIIPGRLTSEATVARVLAVARALKKTPIVVNDGFGLFTTRVFAAFVLEGAQLVAEGHDPAVLEWAARKAGMAVPPLQVLDEVTLALGVHVMEQSRAYVGDRLDLPGTRLLTRMVRELDRPGRAAGRGFYDYVDGRRLRTWPGLRDLVVGKPPQRTGVDHLARRILLVQAAEVARALDEGIVVRYRDAEVGAVFGLGFAPNTGGPLAWMDRQGLPTLVREMDEMAGWYGPRYAPAPLLRRMAEAGTRFYEGVGADRPRT